LRGRDGGKGEQISNLKNTDVPKVNRQGTGKSGGAFPLSMSVKGIFGTQRSKSREMGLKWGGERERASMESGEGRAMSRPRS